MDEYKNETIEGRNAVTEALRAGRALDKVFIARGETDRALAFVAAKARAAGVTVVECDVPLPLGERRPVREPFRPVRRL